MLGHAFSAGLQSLRARSGLALLVYALNLSLAVLLAVSITVNLGNLIADTGFDAELSRGFDLVLFADIISKVPNLFNISITLLFWMLPIILVWNAAMGVGLVDALRDGGSRSFWAGVGRFGGRGVLLSFVFLAPIVAAGIATVILGVVISLVFPGEVGGFWGWGVVVPTFAIAALSILDLMHDYARIALVVDGRSVMDAFFVGLRYPFRHGVSSRLYVLWFFPALVLLIAPTGVEMAIGASFGVFILQQLFLLARAGATVGWFGSETALYEDIARRNAPLLADPSPEAGTDTEPAAVTEVPDGTAAGIDDLPAVV